MKKILLLLIAGAIALTSIGQERGMCISTNPEGTGKEYKDLKKAIQSEVYNKRTLLDKTTAAPRWYSYINYFDTSETDAASSIAFTIPYLWKDTTAIMAYSDGTTTTWAHNRNVSLGLSVDPSFAGFNNYDYYPGQMKITPSNAYTVDSLMFFGVYGFDAANRYVDTLRVTFVYGSGASNADVYMAKTGNPVVLSRYGVSAPDSMKTHRMRFDTNVVRTNGPTAIVRDILLDNTGASPAWGDTLSTGQYVGLVGFPDVNVPAGNMIGATITFLSGDTSFSAHDTAFGSSIGYRSNLFRPYVGYKGTTALAQFATYDSTNRNSGMFKTLPDTANRWGGQYIPLWFWSGSGGGASGFQYPYIDFHIKCPSCDVTVPISVKDVHNNIISNVYPNPAAGTLTIPFTLSGSGNVSVSLSNVIGQEVATQRMNNVKEGQAVFNTSELPSGVYIYSISANGYRKSGKVTIAH
jgi:hypothetical protein